MMSKSVYSSSVYFFTIFHSLCSHLLFISFFLNIQNFLYIFLSQHSWNGSMNDAELWLDPCTVRVKCSPKTEMKILIFMKIILEGKERQCEYFPRTFYGLAFYDQLFCWKFSFFLFSLHPHENNIEHWSCAINFVETESESMEESAWNIKHKLYGMVFK